MKKLISNLREWIGIPRMTSPEQLYGKWKVSVVGGVLINNVDFTHDMKKFYLTLGAEGQFQCEADDSILSKIWPLSGPYRISVSNQQLVLGEEISLRVGKVKKNSISLSYTYRPTPHSHPMVFTFNLVLS
ncbi:hypothetical protein FNH22_08270 [Fulvivirga sp. M361]|uniref:hypothetical protein n=1 Tax=Fulvivirga sp. M361 TaxID=2594266 RepID=UPI00117B9851|nr:hypothetical protein [Fulvivirga sp. M361]TRX60037.1 hypothetical protein FNH22_08270 [Fulvivirga sp. M361]